MSDQFEKLLEQMGIAPNNARFSDLLAICRLFFGEPRCSGTSHCVFKTPWFGDPRVNIQNNWGTAKAYHARQMLAAIQRLQEFKNGCE